MRRRRGYIAADAPPKPLTAVQTVSRGVCLFLILTNSQMSARSDIPPTVRSVFTVTVGTSSPPSGGFISLSSAGLLFVSDIARTLPIRSVGSPMSSPFSPDTNTEIPSQDDRRGKSLISATTVVISPAPTLHTDD